MTEAAADPRPRLTRTIFAGVALGSTSLFAAFTAAVLVATELGVSRSWAGLPGAASVMGAALGSALLAPVMSRRGRRAGLTLGWLVGTAGAVATIVAVTSESFAGLVVGMIVLGVGQASNQLSRFAAADMHPEAKRPAVLGWVVWAGTIGALLGPSLLETGGSVASSIGLPSRTSGFLIAAVFYAAAMACGMALRPDPRHMGEPETAASAADVTLRKHARSSRVKLAIVILATAQLAMTAIMTMTPIHVREHGHDLGVIGLVMSAHLVGMFALSPVIGKVVARVGSLRVAIVGIATVGAAGIAAAASPEHTGLWIGASLFLLGVGWSMSFVAGSAMLTGGLRYAERVQLQGGVDALVWALSATASFSSGFLVGAFGYVTLSLVGGASMLVPLAVVVIAYRRMPPAPAPAA